jgi:hypothetical protein
MAAGRLSGREAANRLRNCVETGWFKPLPHFFDALAEEGLIFSDVLPVLTEGRVTRKPEWRNGEWRYRIERESIAIAFSFQEDMAVLITAFFD